jgi:cytochrome c biogenesis protein CcmG/thiol:disulfide interchange protein DsbE
MRARAAVRAVAGAVVVALGAVLVWHLTHQPASVAPQVARHQVVPAPNFTLDRLTGTGALSLASLRGKAVVVNFWASDCAPCKQEMPRLVSFSRAWSARGVVVVGIDVLEYRKGPARAFTKRFNATYPMVFDPTGTTVGPWGVAATPQTFFVDRRGRIVDHVLGPVTDETLAAGVRRALRA